VMADDARQVPISGSIPYAIGQSSVVRIPIPGTSQELGASRAPVDPAFVAATLGDRGERACAGSARKSG
jgi:hypothetical protein